MSARPTVAVLDYGSGNVHSAVRALESAGADVELTQDRQKLLSADGLVVPGVGAFAAVMDALNASEAPRWIGQRIAGAYRAGHLRGPPGPLRARRRARHRGRGSGEWPGEVTSLPEDVVVPHMGWNTVTPPEGSVLFEGIEDERFYFVHSYAVQKWDFDQSIPQMRAPAVTWAHHGADFVAAVENGPLSATQFHPEKSGEAGQKLLRNWVRS
ncbi:imidazole glycerol phosphate synthase subunit HisH [Nesterenkonia pannonica]|uniref:glutamine amidotransferase-related protein n=1 Tax=Nesterenkonia pannonica TaxID=1548602 RepID=UPI0021646807|nr:imidazole glycerol phosphate synthase subunit HisH [Nesterenkonia pannonica]